MTVQVPDDQTFPVHVTVIDAEGNVVNTPTVNIVIALSNPSLAAVEPDPAHPGDSSFVILRPMEPAGQFVMNASGEITDADGAAMALNGNSEEVDILPGIPACLGIEITATPVGA